VQQLAEGHNLLRAALVCLIAEKPYDSIVVKEILDRANVGSSTFYIHFRDKDDLLVSGIQEMLARFRQCPGRLPEKDRSEFSGSAFQFSSTTVDMPTPGMSGLAPVEELLCMSICGGYSLM
jgi:AcrR family transcriptional regulator